MMTLLLILWPLFIALVIFAFRPVNAKVFAFVASLIEFFITLIIVFQFDTQGKFFCLQRCVDPFPRINFSVAIDGISLLLVLLRRAWCRLLSFRHYQPSAKTS